MARMIATKALRYGTRRLRADDEFTASKRDARVLSAIGRATYATKVVTVHPDPVAAEPVVPAGASDELATLRAEYQSAVGKRAFHGWDVNTLRAKIAEAAQEDGVADTANVDADIEESAND